MGRPLFGIMSTYSRVACAGEYDINQLTGGSAGRFDWPYLSGLRWPTAENEQL